MNSIVSSKYSYFSKQRSKSLKVNCHFKNMLRTLRTYRKETENKREWYLWKTRKWGEAEKPGVLLRQGWRWRQKRTFFGWLMVVVKRHSRTQCSALCLPRGTEMINKNHVCPENVTEIPRKKVNKTISLLKQKLNQFPVSLYYSVTYSFTLWQQLPDRGLSCKISPSYCIGQPTFSLSYSVHHQWQFKPRHIHSNITQG